MFVFIVARLETSSRVIKGLECKFNTVSQMRDVGCFKEVSGRIRVSTKLTDGCSACSAEDDPPPPITAPTALLETFQVSAKVS